MELIQSGRSRYEVYESLLLERDALEKEAGQIWTAYLQRFGGLMTRVYEHQVECVRLKKAIAYCQMALNRGGVVESEALKDYLDRQMAAYYENLKRLQADCEASNRAGTSSMYDVQRSKTLYRRLAKKLHPDINPLTDRHEELKELWQRTLTAYHHNDVRALSELEVLVRKVMADLGAGAAHVDIPDIEEKIEGLRREIDHIKTTPPYTYAPLIEDDAASAEKTAELEASLADYEKYEQQLSDTLQHMIDNGGMVITWPTK